MTKQKPWDKRWHIGKVIGRGGQGTARLVTDKNEADDITYVLKTLNRQEDAERRRRMHREVTILETLVHEGIPRVIESNTDEYDESTALYFVAEYIPGPTLADAVKAARCDLETAVGTVTRIVEIVGHHHREGVIHRDIKPENIILKDGDFSSPVLVDFGLSFNEEPAEAETLTEPQQGLGNRFLWLPELRVEESAKRDARSDITACCGILFYMLTSMNPTSLSDHEGRKPHQRTGAKVLLGDIENVEKRAIVNAVFDTGFETHIDRRWQSADALLAQLEKVLNVSARESESPSPESAVQRMQEQLRTSNTYVSRRGTHSVLNKIDQHLQRVHFRVASELGSDFKMHPMRRSLNLASARLKNRFQFVHSYYPERPFHSRFSAFITGSEVVLTAHHKGQTSELLRTPIANFAPGQEFEEVLREYLVRRAAEFFTDLVSPG